MLCFSGTILESKQDLQGEGYITQKPPHPFFQVSTTFLSTKEPPVHTELLFFLLSNEELWDG
jgi:hypothetical protein